MALEAPLDPTQRTAMELEIGEKEDGVNEPRQITELINKGGAADPCPFLARGRGPSDGGTMWDAPQGFRGCLPPPPIWPETRLRLRDLSASCQNWTQEGAVRTITNRAAETQKMRF